MCNAHVSLHLLMIVPAYKYRSYSAWALSKVDSLSSQNLTKTQTTHINTFIYIYICIHNSYIYLLPEVIEAKTVC